MTLLPLLDYKRVRGPLEICSFPCGGTIKAPFASARRPTACPHPRIQYRKQEAGEDEFAGFRETRNDRSGYLPSAADRLTRDYGTERIP